METVQTQLIIIKIYIAKDMACVTQVKLDSRRKWATVTFNIFVGTCAENVRVKRPPVP